MNLEDTAPSALNLSKRTDAERSLEESHPEVESRAVGARVWAGGQLVFNGDNFSF